MRAASDMLRLVAERLKESIAVKEAILNDSLLMEMIPTVARVCVQALRSGGKLLFFGNGGSAADAQHLVAELVGRYLVRRRALAAVALTTNTSCLTAIGNDYSYDEVFSRQIEAIGSEGDVAIGISTSGNSQNIVRAMRTAREKSLVTVGMTGRDGGKLRGEVGYCLRIPSGQTPRIQEAHILLGHIICEIIEGNFADTRGIS